MELGLGTAQLGLDYGITNARGKVSEREAENILKAAIKHGIELFDTAPGYGTSEEVLGKLLLPNSRFKIVTKVPRFDKSVLVPEDCHNLLAVFHRSLKKLRQDAVYALLFHYPQDLLTDGAEGLFEAAQALKIEGKIKKIGVSVYTLEEAEMIMGRFPIEVIQIPVNILDQRFPKSGILKELKNRGIEIHGRSIFLQGILLADPEALPSFFLPLKPLLHQYQHTLSKKGLTLIEGAMGYVHQLEIDFTIVGAASESEWKESLSAFESAKHLSGVDFSIFSCEDSDMINPTKWPSASMKTRKAVRL